MIKEAIQGSFFVKRLVLIVVFFTITPITLFASVLSLVSITNSNDSNNNLVSSLNTKEDVLGVQVFSSSESDFPSVSADIISADARPEIIKNFLASNNSPMEPYSKYIVDTADKYNLDYRLITAIAQKESGLCRVIPEDSYNCWGWGIHSEGTLGFDNFEEGIETVSKGLRENYLDKGYSTVEQIMQKYAHPDSTTWAEGVLYYMEQME